MDRVREATFELTAGNGKLRERGMEAKRGVNGVRKDRHSKVLTARGARDRRVRLSPKTAILFYDVQERLGCDRPSKAIDWLMKEAKAAIDALDHRPPAAANPSSTNVAEAAPPPREVGEDRQEQLTSAPTPQELFDANSELLKLQRFFSLNYSDDGVSLAPFHYPAPAPANFHPFGEREPLQSSYSRFNYSNSSQFQGFGFLEEDPELPTL